MRRNGVALLLWLAAAGAALGAGAPSTRPSLIRPAGIALSGIPPVQLGDLGLAGGLRTLPDQQLIQIPRVAYHVADTYVEPVEFGLLTQKAADGIVQGLGPAASPAAFESLSKLKEALLGPDGRPIPPAQATPHVMSRFRELWDGGGFNLGPEGFVRTGLRSMLGSLDAHSEFYDPDQYARLQVLFRGHSGKLGVTFEDKADGPRLITGLASGSPAKAAGLRLGDEVVAVDGVAAHGLGLEAFRALLRKPEVVLTIRRREAGAERLFDATVRRGDFKPQVLSSALLPGQAGYLRVAMFQTDSAAEIQGRLLRLMEDGARVLVLDLRGNPGGEEQTVLQAASLFLRGGQVILRYRDRRGTDEVSVAEDGELVEVPVKVLVDGETMSAAEILAAALQDNGRGLLVGRRTYGKGTAQQFFELEDGSAFKITVKRWYTPKGRHLDREAHGGGLEPDIEVPPPSAPANGPDLALDRALKP